ncbi:MAG: ABC transporter ATP-binding protein [Actinobacteria bacterium]|nr:ABC transporter ATP-binding protein [Actinomycetota bacterium]
MTEVLPDKTAERGPLLSVQNLTVEFKVGRGRVAHAVSDVSLEIYPGETVGVVGESGCGKSTVGKAIVQLVKSKSGSIFYDGRNLAQLSGKELREVRLRLQMIFQDPISSLNPRRKVVDIVREPLAIWKVGDAASRQSRARDLLEQVGVDPDNAGARRPYELSGGQCQRVSIARALAIAPQLLICDEPVSALDVSVQAQVLNLLEELKQEHQLTVIFISHDLSVVKHISDRIVVMYLGRIAETAPAQDIYERPAHPYTYGLLAAIPEKVLALGGETSAAAVSGELPSPINPPSGCRFRTRCFRAQERCAREVPELRPIAPGHEVACHFPLEPGEIPPELASK